MNPWATFWGIVFLLAFGSFAILAVVISIGGFGDLRALLKKLIHSRPEEDSTNESN